MKLFNDLVEKRKKEKEEKKKLNEKELIEALKTYDYAKVIRLLNKGVDVNCTVTFEDENNSKFDNTPLAVATKYSDLEMMKILIKYGANLEQLSQNLTPLAIAIADGNMKKIELLAKNGAKLNYANIYSVYTPLGFAIVAEQSKEVVELLLDLGADINTQDYYGDSAIMRASFVGNAEIVKLLIDKGAILTLNSNEGHLYGTDGEYPVRYTALMYACAFDYIDVVKVLLDAGVDVNTFNSKGWTPLILATMYGRTEIVKFLINAGANIDWQDKLDVTPLMYAANNISSVTKKTMTEEWHVDLTCYKEIIDILLKAGANVNLQSKYGGTALHSAVLGMQPDDEEITKILEEVILLLINAGADPYIEDMTGKNCFVHMCRRDNSKTHLLVKKES